MIAALQSIREEVLNEISDIPQESINERENEEKWSIGQVLDHLQRTERVVTQSVKYILTKGKECEVTDKPLEIIVDRSRKVTAPENIAPTNEPVDKLKAITLLEESRRDLLNFLETLPEDTNLKNKAMKHPFVGDLSTQQWIEFIGYHERRHLYQLREIKEAIL
ncbi:DinB family protein [Metabacillus herbersteinensis]|uniref:DinB family protein n=1 Tax=Metabacillus herbersteinensis TaxID=283816 RepID=A0ABV6GC62_9BACI